MVYLEDPFWKVWTEKCIYHIDAAMLPIVDFVMPYNGTAVGSDLDSSQGVTIDVITLY